MIDNSIWRGNQSELHEIYMQASPFPHMVFDGFCDSIKLHQACNVFPDVTGDQWIHYLHYNEKKHGLNRIEAFPAVIRELITELNSPEFVKWLSELTGIDGLFSDTDLEGGGLHQSERGGYLRIHSDFTSHPHHPDWHRRVNVLVYLNPGWEEAYGGQLEFWGSDMQHRIVQISPLFNRCVIFNTDKTSYHGHPEPLVCPPHITRKSIALYYYTNDNAGPSSATTYVARPQDRTRRTRIRLDNSVLKIYHWMKQTFGIHDGAISKVLGYFTKWNK